MGSAFKAKRHSLRLFELNNLKRTLLKTVEQNLFSSTNCREQFRLAPQHLSDGHFSDTNGGPGGVAALIRP